MLDPTQHKTSSPAFSRLLSAPKTLYIPDITYLVCSDLDAPDWWPVRQAVKSRPRQKQCRSKTPTNAIQVERFISKKSNVAWTLLLVCVQGFRPAASVVGRDNETPSAICRGHPRATLPPNQTSR